jgi:DNA-binding protein HU-beta
MNKTDLIDHIAKQSSISKAAAGKALDALTSGVIGALAKGQSVGIVGFGTFKPAKRAARLGRNPKTGEAMKIAAKTVPSFKAGSSFKESLAFRRKR